MTAACSGPAAFGKDQEHDPRDQRKAADHRRDAEAFPLLGRDVHGTGVDHGVAIGPEHPAERERRNPDDDEDDTHDAFCRHDK